MCTYAAVRVPMLAFCSESITLCRPMSLLPISKLREVDSAFRREVPTRFSEDFSTESKSMLGLPASPLAVLLPTALVDANTLFVNEMTERTLERSVWA